MNRTRLIRIAVALIVLGGLGFAMFHAREPRYQGRTLTEWIDDVKQPPRSVMTPRDKKKSAESDAAWQASSNAVKHIGPDAIPFLLRWVKAGDSPMRETLSDWLANHPSLHFRIKSAYECCQLSFCGFGLLGPEAKTAWPTLSQWTSSTDTYMRFIAFSCLANSKPDKETLLPVLLRLMHDPNTSIQQTALRVFHQRFPEDAAAAGVYVISPELKNRPANQVSNGIFGFE